MNDHILLTFNPGSSTIKLGLYRLRQSGPERIGGGGLDLRETPLTLRIREGETREDIALRSPASDDLTGVIGEIMEWLSHHFDAGGITAAGHRVVHGGDRFAGPVLIDGEAEAAIAGLTPLAPLHQPQALRLIRAVRQLWPGLPQTASFDTAFHRSQSDLVRRLALPRALFDQGIKRYGFHGLSYRYIAGKLAREAPEIARGNVVAAHLGSGASLCGMQAGLSRDTSMGFSTLDGIPMATRCGALDAGVVLHFLQQMGLSADAVEDILYHRSGLLGVSGISADARVLLESDAPAAKQAMALFCLRTAQTVAALATTLGGLDGLVFTAGIGEHQPEVRQAVCEGLGWLGVRLDARANAANADRIEAGDSSVPVLVMRTDEEQIIAEEAASLLPDAAGGV